MKAVLLGLLGHVGKPLTAKFVKEGIDTTVITRSESNAKFIEEAGAKAAVGSSEDVEFLTKTFTGADFVFLLCTINLSSDNYMEESEKQFRGLVEAVLNSGVQNVVYLSSVGAHKPNNGCIHLHYVNEQIAHEELKKLDHVSIVRPTGFYENTFRYLPTIKSMNKIFSFNSPELHTSMVDLRYLAEVVYNIAMNPPQEMFYTEHVDTDRFTNKEFTEILSTCLNTSEPIQWIQVPEEAAIEAMVGTGMSKVFAADMIEFIGDKNYNLVAEEVVKTKLPETEYTFKNYASTIYKQAYENLK